MSGLQIDEAKALLGQAEQLLHVAAAILRDKDMPDTSSALSDFAMMLNERIHGAQQ